MIHSSHTKEFTHLMLRSALAVSLSVLLVTLPIVAQTSIPATPNTSAAWFEKQSDETLAHYFGTNGVLGDHSIESDYKDFTMAQNAIVKRANKGDATAAYVLGRDAEFPTLRSMKRDYKRAMAWYELAAKGGNLAAGYRLGELYRMTDPVNLALPFQWTQWATNKGFDPRTIRNPRRIDSDDLRPTNPDYALSTKLPNEKKTGRYPTPPNTAKAPTQAGSSDTDGLLAVGGLVLLGALLLGGNSSDDHSTEAKTADGKTIVVDDSKLTCLIDRHDSENKQIPGCDAGKLSCWQVLNYTKTERNYGKVCRTNPSAYSLAVTQ